MSTSHDTMMAVARLFADRSTCERGHVGAVLVRDRRIISTGYNGAPPGMPHCTDPLPKDPAEQFSWGKPDRGTLGCDISLGPDAGCQRTVHAEANAIAFAAMAGVPTNCAMMYCTHAPCYTCAKLMVSAGIVSVVYQNPYRIHAGLLLLQDAGITTLHLP